ncbi:MAG: helix-turn-helix transcriptional regulator [Schwartzia sp.]|nr:helix-turn-helix transcriptional regulator [Schwartzia sp. (in: firmicutes)]
MDDLDRLLEEQMQDPEFRREWENSQLEYEITEMLIKARKSQHVSQKELAARAGLRQSNLSRIENGQCVPSLNTLQKIAHGLGKRLRLQFV